jgi:hypothetical protein
MISPSNREASIVANATIGAFNKYPTDPCYGQRIDFEKRDDEEFARRRGRAIAASRGRSGIVSSPIVLPIVRANFLRRFAGGNRMRTEVEAAIVQFEGVSQRITQVVATMSLEARGRLIELRRDHAIAMQRLNDAAGQALRGVSHPDIHEITAQFHQHFGDMRRAIALHQGKWPAVLIGENNQAYAESAQIADAAKVKAVTWVRRVLVPIL